MKKTVLITGASSGIGKAAARFFAGRGWNVAATLRSPEKETELAGLENVWVTRLDVRDEAGIRRAVRDGIARFGGIDALVNNAGFSLAGPFEAVPREKIREQFDVNLFGVMDVTRAVLPHFREKKGGVVVNISSRGGRVALPLLSLYCASKFALEGFSESLAYELAALGIRVKVVAPGGGADTRFSQRMAAERAHNRPLPDYDGFAAAVAGANALFAKKREGHATRVEEIAGVIYEAATDGTDRLHYPVGRDIPPFLQARKEMDDQDYVDFMRSQFRPKP